MNDYNYNGYTNGPDNEEMGWDDTISEEQTFVLLPEGEYNFTVKDFRRDRYQPRKGGKLPACNKAVLTIEIDGGENGRTTLEHNLFLHKKTEGLLSAFFLSIGQKKHGEPLRMNWAAVPGSRGRCRVRVREYEYQGEKRARNEISRFIETPSQTSIPSSMPQKGTF